MYKKFIEELLSHKKIAVFSHIRPDGDCLGSQIAICQWLFKNGVKAEAFNEDPINANLKWMLPYFPVNQPDIHALDQYDAFLFMDGNALHRFGMAAEKAGTLSKPLYMIDHHPEPEPIFKDFISDTEASSTCELVYRMIEEQDINQIDESIAKPLYTGIVTDTGSFQFSSVKPSTLKAGAELLARGNFTPDTVVEEIYSSKKMNQLRLLGMSLETISLHADQQIATMYVTQQMLSETGTTNEDTEGFVSYPLSIEGVKACVFFREVDDHVVKMSLRSRSEIDVNKWARQLNGGGHKKASGAKYVGSLKDAIRDTIEIGTQQI